MTLGRLGILFGFAQVEYPNFLLVFTGLTPFQWQFIICRWSCTPPMLAHDHHSITRLRCFGLLMADPAKWPILCPSFFFLKRNSETSWATTPSLFCGSFSTLIIKRRRNPQNFSPIHFFTLVSISKIFQKLQITSSGSLSFIVKFSSNFLLFSLFRKFQTGQKSSKTKG